MKSIRIITCTLVATVVIAETAQAMPLRDSGLYGKGQTAVTELRERQAAKQPTTFALHIRRGPLAV